MHCFTPHDNAAPAPRGPRGRLWTRWSNLGEGGAKTSGGTGHHPALAGGIWVVSSWLLPNVCSVQVFHVHEGVFGGGMNGRPVWLINVVGVNRCPLARTGRLAIVVSADYLLEISTGLRRQ